MSDTAHPVDIRVVRYVGGVLALIVAGIHVFHPRLGYPRLVEHLLAGTLFDPRPLVFTVSGLAIVVGVLLVFNGIVKRPIYLGGIVLMLTYLLGYVAWHTVLDHGGFWPHIEAHGHDTGLFQTMMNHLQADILDLVSKVSEFLLLILLVYLYITDK